jgi:hypothetical protein
MSPAIVVSISAVILAYILFLRVLILKKVIKVPLRLVIGLAALQILLAVLYLLTRNSSSELVKWLFDLDLERTLDPTFAALQLIAVGVSAFALSAIKLYRQQKRGLIWALYGLIFILIGLDEYYAIHENFTDSWFFIYAGMGIILALGLLVMGWFQDRQYFLTHLLAVFGLGVMGGGGVVVELLRVYTPYHFLVVEEFLEKAGVTFTLLAVITLIVRESTTISWERAKRTLIGVSAFGLLLLIGANFWPLPMLEARFLAQPMTVDYLDGDLEVVAYRLRDRVIYPGEDANLSLYFRANAPLPRDYAFSARLLSQPDGAIIAQEDISLGYPTTPPTDAWPVGMIFRKDVSIPVPADAPAPASYWLALNVWNEPWDETRQDNMLLISHTDQNLLLPDTAVFASVALLPSEAPAPPSQPVDFRFAEGIRLAGYALPTEVHPGETISFEFWWQTESVVGHNLTQFLHLYHVESNRYFLYDQPPFAGKFPTRDWPANVQAVDRWQFSPGQDLPPGEYQLYSGLYDSATQERIAVESAGQPQPDNRILLGTLQVTAD